jgi:hypothetical protein
VDPILLKYSQLLLATVAPQPIATHPNNLGKAASAPSQVCNEVLSRNGTRIFAAMSSGFVSGGTIDEPADRDKEWLHAQQELEEERRRKAEMGRQEGGKSLYEVLQQNKSR